MALPISGPISLSQVQGEFGGANPISLIEYYRGGPYTTSNNTSVPTSGAISLSNFYGATRSVVVAYNVIGGGGGGAGGGNRPYAGGAGGYSQIYGSGFATVTSSGGAGGLPYSFASSNGAASAYGAGGAAGINAEYGTPGSGGAAPASSYGAGGGGGGSRFDGYAGLGGSAASLVSSSQSVVPGTVLSITVGSGGYGGSGGLTSGGAGAGGRVIIYRNGVLVADYTTPGTYSLTVPA